MKHAKKVSSEDTAHQGGGGAAKPQGKAAQPAKEFDLGDEKRKRRRKALVVLGAVCGTLVALVLVAYVAGALVFQDRFLPRTTVGEIDLSLKSAEEASAILDESVADYELSVAGVDFSLRLTGADAGLAFDADATVRAMLDSRNPWHWPLDILQPRDESEAMTASYDQTALTDAVMVAVDELNAQATPPSDAFIAYDESRGQFAIVPDAVGTALDGEKVVAAAGAALASLDPVAELAEEHLAKPTILRDDDALVQATASANGLILADVSFLLGATPAVVLDADVINAWVVIAEDYAVSLNEEALVAWASETAATCTTCEGERTYTRADGKEITVSGGSYGWIVDEAAFLDMVRTAVETDQVASLSLPVTQEAATFAAEGRRDWGSRYVDVDLSEQHAYFYGDDGALVWESDIVSGVPSGGQGSITPTGVYTLTANAAPATLKGTDWDGSKYESPVRYWMPFVGNLIGLHDADWQWAFGGTRYRDGAGSHGCVNLPVDKAAELATLIGTGDVVVVHW